MPQVIALAGRRIDAADAETPRFPLANVPLVRDRLRALFAARQVARLVCSAACGADLVALEVAEELGLPRRIVLPFAPERFRETSVADRPGGWESLYDRLVETAQRTNDLVLLEYLGEGSGAYESANARIIEEALTLAREGSERPEPALALILWEGRSRVKGDATQQFAELAKQQGLEVGELLTV